MTHTERQKLLNDLNFYNELLCKTLDRKIVIMEDEKKYRRLILKTQNLLAADEEDPISKEA